MKITSTPFSEMPFSALFQDYISTIEKPAPFFETDPFNEKDIEKKLASFSFKGDRLTSAQYLAGFNKQFGAGANVLKSINKLKDPNSLSVVTGQQVMVYGGPLFTIYKTITAIIYAKRWEKKYNRPVVPVFWLADEDHDYKEAATIGIPDGDEVKKLFLEASHAFGPRVSDIRLDENFEGFRNQIKEFLFATDFSQTLWYELDDSYQKGATFSEAFGTLLLKIFGKHGLVLAGTNNKEAARFITKPLAESVQKATEAQNALKTASDKLLDAGYHNQVHVQKSNLFWIDENGSREKISFENEEWFVDGQQKTWTSDELIDDIKSEPNRFSPNVFLRPLTQDYIIPTCAYIAGPGEISYYAQTKDFYSVLGLTMPVIIPRFSATLIESGIERILKKLPFEPAEYKQRIEDLESRYITHADTPDIEQIFNGWKQSVHQCSELGIRQIADIDPTLEGSSKKVMATFENELDKLKGKVYRSVKEQEKIQIERINRIQKNLFPNGNLQEREVTFIYFINKYGFEIWDHLLEKLENELPDKHKWIEL